MNLSGLQTPRSIAQMVLTVMGMGGIAALFLPFTWGVSPVEATFERGYWLVASPAFLSVLISAASIRWIVSGSLSKTERTIAYVVSALAAGLTLSIWLFSKGGPSTAREWLPTTIPASILVLGVGLLIRNSRVKATKGFNPVMAMQAAYLAHATLFFVESFRGLDVGAYFVLAAAITFALQSILVSVQQAGEVH